MAKRLLNFLFVMGMKWRCGFSVLLLSLFVCSCRSQKDITQATIQQVQKVQTEESTQDDYEEVVTWYLEDTADAHGGCLPPAAGLPPSVFHGLRGSAPKATPTKGLRPVAAKVTQRHASGIAQRADSGALVTHADISKKVLEKRVPFWVWWLFVFLFVDTIGLFVYFICKSRR